MSSVSSNPVVPLAQSAVLTVVTPPAARVVTASELQRHCRVDTTIEGDGYFNLLIDAATEYAEARLSASLIPRTLAATFSNTSLLDLPRGPVIEIISIADGSGSPVSTWETVGIGNITRVVLANGSDTSSVVVTYRAGYVSAADPDVPAIPADIKLAILMHAATLYTNRETVSDKAMVPVPHTLDMFYGRKCRTVGVG